MTLQISRKIFFWINIIWFQASWFVAIIYTQQAVLVLTLSILTHFLLSPTRLSDLRNLVFISLIGIVADNFLSYIGMLNFPNDGFIPLWLILLWGHFALTLNHSMKWLVKIPIYLQVLFGAIFGTLSYYAGSKLGAVNLHTHLILSLFFISLAWAILLPFYIKISKYNRSHSSLP